MAAFQFAVIHCGEWEGSSKGPDLEAEKFLLFCWQVSQSMGGMSDQDGAALSFCLNEQNRSCREEPVLFLFYRNGGLGCKPPNLHLLCLVLKILWFQTSSLLEEHDILKCKLVTGMGPDSLQMFWGFLLMSVNLLGLCGHFILFKKPTLFLCSYCCLETK